VLLQLSQNEEEDQSLVESSSDEGSGAMDYDEMRALIARMDEDDGDDGFAPVSGAESLVCFL
jgi:hypothetical protein